MSLDNIPNYTPKINNETVWFPVFCNPITNQYILCYGNHLVLPTSDFVKNIGGKILEESMENLPFLLRTLEYNGFIIKEDIQTEDNNSVEKCILLNEHDEIKGFLYFVKENYEAKIELKKIEDKVVCLVSNYKDNLCAFKRDWSKSGLILLILSEDIKPLSDNTKIILLNSPKYNFFFELEKLEIDDIGDLNGTPVILNPEKIIPKDYMTENLYQKFQIFYKDGKIKINDCHEEIKKEIYALIKRNDLKAICY